MCKVCVETKLEKLSASSSPPVHLGLHPAARAVVAKCREARVGELARWAGLTVLAWVDCVAPQKTTATGRLVGLQKPDVRVTFLGRDMKLKSKSHNNHAPPAAHAHPRSPCRSRWHCRWKTARAGTGRTAPRVTCGTLPRRTRSKMTHQPGKGRRVMNHVLGCFQAQCVRSTEEKLQAN